MSRSLFVLYATVALLIVSLNVLVSSPAQLRVSAAPALALNNCDKSLERGVYNTYISTSNAELSYVIAATILTSSKSEAEKKLGGGVDISIAGYPLGADYTETEYKTYQDRLRKTENVDLLTTFYTYTMRSEASSVLLDAWVTCIKANSHGVFSSLQRQDSQLFYFELESIPFNTDEPLKIYTDITVSGGDIIGNDKVFTAGKVIPASMGVQIKRRGSEAIAININTSFGPVYEYAPPIIKLPKAPPPKPPPPVTKPKPKPPTPVPFYKEVSAPSDTAICSDVCTGAKLKPLISGRNSDTGSPYYFCSARGNGFLFSLPGYNIVGPRDTGWMACNVGVNIGANIGAGSFAINNTTSAFPFSCACTNRPDLYKVIPATSLSCQDVCEEKKMRRLSPGFDFKGDPYYYCSYNAGGNGQRAGFNLFTFAGCTVGWGTGAHSTSDISGPNRFSCLCGPK